MRTVSLADANRYFSKIAREVADGEPVVVTARGKPIIRMEAVAQPDVDEAARQQEWLAFLEERAAQPPLNLGKITRDEIYDDD